MPFNSLAFRLFVTAAAWTLLVLPIVGLVIDSLYRKEAEAHFNDRLYTLVIAVLADSVEDTTIEPNIPNNVVEPLFATLHSGWYWQFGPVENPTGRRGRSDSLATASLPSPMAANVAPTDRGVRWADVIGPLGQPVRLAEMIHTYSDEMDGPGPRYSFIVSGPLDWLDARIAGFRTGLAIALLIVGVGLVAGTVFQVRFGLLPLRAIEHGLSGIRSGAATRLEGALPAEIQPLQLELNALIHSNEQIVERARAHVGNLAHALKTPLAVIINEARDDKSPFASKVTEQAQIMRSQVSHHLVRATTAARAGTSGRVTQVKPVAEALRRALERIYKDKGIAIHIDCSERARFLGERPDLDDMLGNLLDNACKWARSSVRLTADLVAAAGNASTHRLHVLVEDDGPGLPSEVCARLGKRGQRFDGTKPGSGLGLSIVTDLVQAYHGTLNLAASPLGGLAARLELPAV